MKGETLMKKNRILSLVMALVMLLGVASASAESLNLAQLPLTAEEGATISILAINSYYSNVDLKDATLLKEIADRAGVTIEWTLIDPSSYADSVSPMLASGKDLPDIIMMPDKDLNMDYLSSGLVEALDEHLDIMPNYSAFLEKNPIIKGSLTAVDGHIYYVPQTVVYATGIVSRVVGATVKQKDVTEFYYTLSSSTNPPRFQRYRFYTAEGKYYFYHEKREGDHWPLREEDVTVSGTKETGYTIVQTEDGKK